MMKLPESTTRGRLLDQSQLELYELDRTREFQVPVEELVVASRKIRRCAEQDSDFATVSRIYSEERNSWRHQYQGDNADMPVDRLICHRCGVEGSDMFVDHIAITPSAISCSKCLQSCKKFGKSGTFLKACRCQGCASHHALALSEAFKNQPRKFVSRENQQLCAVCCLYCKSGMVCNDCGFTIHKRCAKWIQKVDPGFGTQARFHCRTCHPVKQDSISSDALSAGLLKVKCMNFTDFDLPQAFTSLPCTQPANKPIVALKPRGKIIRRVVRSSSSKSCDDADHKHRRKHDRPKLSNEISKVEQCCQNGFTESCLRLLPYDPVTRSFEGIAKHQIEVTSSRQEVVRNLRSEESTKMEEKKTAVRAARASQRRIMKDVVAFGSSLLELDALTGRESHLRFGRSGIHAWGVFADQEIREGEVIVEYRGEIIGNATAEKREAEYVQAKIGSDYMFRMDGNNVCDATKRGNVARYINASCDPNCYTQIISINNAKRIVIYAKKDIPVGQELCYDYKFPVEFDEAKRVACYCGAKDCREFMNWDKRYVSVAAPTGAGTEPTSSAPRSSNHHRAPEVGLDALSDRKA
ncbi:[histone H3]-lysine4 N-trimethyltransferase SETD1 [Fragilaria crotonensis]|nr:[histone H3]-lysine4 N-trimethyltransferase SETD1 [Fragilaria crotonensis]